MKINIYFCLILRWSRFLYQ